MSHIPPDTYSLSEGQLSLDLITSEHFDYRVRRLPQDLLEHPALLAGWTQYRHRSMISPPDARAEAAQRV